MQVASLHGMQRAGERPSRRRLADHTGLEALYVSKPARALESADCLSSCWSHSAASSPRGRAFTDELTTLLDAPLAPSVPNDERTQGAPP
ncbi:hypothetical protein O1M54_04600 [Streptomyces diastatochromogenes]|nr:hypothetical protein [Streptomyces diastatochromogenes]